MASRGIVHYRRELLNELLQAIFSKNFINIAKECKLIKDKKLTPKKFTSYLFKDDDHVNTSENQFALLSTTKNKYTEPKPFLTLGTVLKKNDKYFICIIPRCDAARIMENEQSFPFLRLLAVSDEKPFDVVLKDKGQYIKLKIDYKPYNLFIQSFRKSIEYFGITNKPLYAELVTDQYVFTSHSDDCYVWISELKKEKAQAISNHFSAQLSRVGFNESEYLRRSYE